MGPTKFDETHLRNLLLFSTKNQFVLWRQWKTVSVCSKLKLKRMVGNIVEINLSFRVQRRGILVFFTAKVLSIYGFMQA